MVNIRDFSSDDVSGKASSVVDDEEALVPGGIVAEIELEERVDKLKFFGPQPKLLQHPLPSKQITQFRNLLRDRINQIISWERGSNLCCQA